MPVVPCVNSRDRVLAAALTWTGRCNDCSRYPRNMPLPTFALRGPVHRRPSWTFCLNSVLADDAGPG